MKNIYNSAEGQTSYAEHVEVSSVLQVEASDQSAADAIARSLLIAAVGQPRHDGPLRIDTQYDAAQTLVQIAFTGSIRATARMLDHKMAAGERLFHELTKALTVVQIDGFDRVMTIGLIDALTAATNSYPGEHGALRIDTDYDDRRRLFKLTIAGAIFATTYLLFIVGMHLSQRTRALAVG
jgi:hypothetical protein